MPLTSRSASVLGLSVLTLVLAGCASAPHGTATVTSARLDRPSLAKILVTESGAIAIVDREGCMAMVREIATPAGTIDELQTRCTKPGRMDTWFEGAERVTARMPLEPLALDRTAVAHEGRGHTLDEGDEHIVDPKGPPTAKVLDANGKISKVTQAADVTKLNVEVRALAAELAGAEKVAPGPATASGWQMLHVSGPARVVFAGTPTRGRFEARVSTSGQYLCEYTTTVDGDAPLRATKSGWIKPTTAARVVDVVLGPAEGPAASGGSESAYAAGTKAGAEHRSGSTAAVFARFSEVQDALGDACLPELEPPSSGTSI